MTKQIGSPNRPAPTAEQLRCRQENAERVAAYQTSKRSGTLTGEPMKLPNDYMATPELHAAYMRRCADSYRTYMDAKAAAMFEEAAAIHAKAKAATDPKQAASLGQKASRLAEVGACVERDGLAFYRAMYAGARRVLESAQVAA